MEDEVEVVEEETVEVLTRKEQAIRSLIGAGIGLAVWAVGNVIYENAVARRQRKKYERELLERICEGVKDLNERVYKIENPVEKTEEES